MKFEQPDKAVGQINFYVNLEVYNSTGPKL